MKRLRIKKSLVVTTEEVSRNGTDPNDEILFVSFHLWHLSHDRSTTENIRY
jgi:hypothetical protein